MKYQVGDMFVLKESFFNKVAMIVDINEDWGKYKYLIEITRYYKNGDTLKDSESFSEFDIDEMIKGGFIYCSMVK
jgi:hypothetical protein